jgi:DNA replication protein DnaC
MLRDGYNEDSPFSFHELLDRLCAVDLLHIDDVGAEQTSDWVLEQLYTIVNTRYEDGKALVLTTNLDPTALQAQIGQRTVSRLVEICGQPLPVFGADRRLEQKFQMPAAAPPSGEDDDAFWEGAEDAPRYGTPRTPS